MKDNLSIVILMIVFVLLVVMFPLYNFFERQDNMSYNLALKATINFVDEVLNNGYIDSDTYTEYILNLGNTGNIYDIEFEAHRQIITEDPENLGKGIYITQYKIDYNNDIFDTISSSAGSATLETNLIKNNIYQLEIGDQFYIKLKNSNTTPAGALFNSIITTSSKERIVINYGGVVKNTAWKSIDATYDAKNEELDFASSEDNYSISMISSTGKNELVTAYISLATEKRNQVINGDGTVRQYDSKKYVAVDECNGKFELIHTYKQLVHSCYFTIKNCAEGNLVKATCPASMQRDECTVLNTQAGIVCPICGQFTLNMKFNLKCNKCDYTTEYVYPHCANCVSKSYGMTISDIKFILNKHEASFCKNVANVNTFYRNVKVYKCNRCNAVYEDYEKFSTKCSSCKVYVNNKAEIQGKKEHNLILKIK